MAQGQSETWLDQARKLYSARQFAGAMAAAQIDQAVSLRAIAEVVTGERITPDGQAQET